MGVLPFIAALVQALAWPIVIVALAVVFRRQLRTLVVQFAERMKDLKSLRAPGTEIQFAETLLAARAEIAQLPEAVTEFPWVETEDKEAKDKESQQEPGLKPRPEEPAQSGVQYVPGPGRAASGPPRLDDTLPVPQEYARDRVTRDDIRRSVIRAQDFVKDSPEETVLAAWRYVDDSIRSVGRDIQMWVNPDRGEWAHAWNILDFLEQRGALSGAKEVFSIIQKLRTLKDSVIHGNSVSPLEAYDYGVSALQVVQVIKNAYYKMQAAQDRIRGEEPEPSEP
jgi:hypothetical protein